MHLVRDVYETAKKAGKFRTIPRTEGVSTTDILGRMLVQTKEHHLKAESVGALGSRSKFLTTTKLLQLFSSNLVSPTEDMRIIYIDGAWDMVSPSNSQYIFLANFFRRLMNISCCVRQFHPGHVTLLKEAKEVSVEVF